MGCRPRVLHELRHTAQRVGSHASLDQQTHPLVGWFAVEARFEPGFQRRTGEALYSLQARNSGEAFELHLLYTQKKPGISSAIQALQRSPAVCLRPARLVP